MANCIVHNIETHCSTPEFQIVIVLYCKECIFSKFVLFHPKCQILSPKTEKTDNCPKFDGKILSFVTFSLQNSLKPFRGSNS